MPLPWRVIFACLPFGALTTRVATRMATLGTDGFVAARLGILVTTRRAASAAVLVVTRLVGEVVAVARRATATPASCRLSRGA